MFLLITWFLYVFPCSVTKFKALLFSSFCGVVLKYFRAQLLRWHSCFESIKYRLSIFRFVERWIGPIDDNEERQRTRGFVTALVFWIYVHHSDRKHLKRFQSETPVFKLLRRRQCGWGQTLFLLSEMQMNRHTQIRAPLLAASLTASHIPSYGHTVTLVSLLSLALSKPRWLDTALSSLATSINKLKARGE